MTSNFNMKASKEVILIAGIKREIYMLAAHLKKIMAVKKSVEYVGDFENPADLIAETRRVSNQILLYADELEKLFDGKD